VNLKRRKLISLTQTCAMCPSQWEGILDNGKHVYVRYRWGQITLRVGKNLDAAIDSRHYLFKQIGEDFDGILSSREMLKVLNLEVIIMRRVKSRPKNKITYCVYPANYRPGIDKLHHFKTMRQALKKALLIGDGACIDKKNDVMYKNGCGLYYTNYQYVIAGDKRIRVVYNLTERFGRRWFYRSGARGIKNIHP
jgi:hypothetical protein